MMSFPSDGLYLFFSREDTGLTGEREITDLERLDPGNTYKFCNRLIIYINMIFYDFFTNYFTIFLGPIYE